MRGGAADWTGTLGGIPSPRLSTLPPARLGQEAPLRDQAQAALRGAGPRQKGQRGRALQPASQEPGSSPGRASLPPSWGQGAQPVGSSVGPGRLSPSSAASHQITKLQLPGTSPKGQGGQAVGRGPWESCKPPRFPGLRSPGGAWEQPWPGRPSLLPSRCVFQGQCISAEEEVWPEGGLSSCERPRKGLCLSPGVPDLEPGDEALSSWAPNAVNLEWSSGGWPL